LQAQAGPNTHIELKPEQIQQLKEAAAKKDLEIYNSSAHTQVTPIF